MTGTGEEEPLVVVFESTDQSAIGVAESLLREAGIPSVRYEQGTPAPPWTGVRTYGLVTWQLLVVESDAGSARALLEDLSRPIPPGEETVTPRGRRATRGARFATLLLLGFLAILLLAKLWNVAANLF